MASGKTDTSLDVLTCFGLGNFWRVVALVARFLRESVAAVLVQLACLFSFSFRGPRFLEGSAWLVNFESQLGLACL